MTMLRLFTPPTNVPLGARVFCALLQRIRVGHLTLVAPDGSTQVFGKSNETPGATLQIRDWRACRQIMRAGDIGFAEAYIAGWIDTSDIAALLRLALRNRSTIDRSIVGSRLSRVWFRLRHALRRNSRAGSRRNIHAHYDLGNRFYGLWLDPTWTYSSALFEGDAQRSLADAQRAKYQHIVDTLGLRPGQRVLEIGCGWGGFALHAASQGIAVHGITLSHEQLSLAQARIADARASPLATVSLTDYRDVQGQFDAVVSIEMFEAVGQAYWTRYFNVLAERLRPSGRALIQTITIADAAFEAYRGSSDFIREFIFPGGMLPSVSRFVASARRSGLHASETMSFGLDYARTLNHWHAAFSSRIDEVRAQGFDETFIRTWRLYLKYCEAAFDERRIDVNQFLLTRGA
ncbi:SAM-dependent methyltransferase [Pandoraea oxalativorans]|uniref:Cyclopropane-fatty-acyl-phospholipid synthase n=1 Tax=Pandoraea oxalativorans TaxID=573737 RepID=A0A0E3YE76_9BURK|nr:cyclopropane-fatty-acyl-phospholipid synthase family protein [Pandoraea oxalativorans]AKC70750.1 cyclopropane-fatty-acyl-phospholipid synthase [Pandoraea oxalativorans]